MLKKKLFQELKRLVKFQDFFSQETAASGCRRG